MTEELLKAESCFVLRAEDRADMFVQVYKKLLEQGLVAAGFLDQVVDREEERTRRPPSSCKRSSLSWYMRLTSSMTPEMAVLKWKLDSMLSVTRRMVWWVLRYNCREASLSDSASMGRSLRKQSRF